MPVPGQTRVTGIRGHCLCRRLSVRRRAFLSLLFFFFLNWTPAIPCPVTRLPGSPVRAVLDLAAFLLITLRKGWGRPLVEPLVIVLGRLAAACQLWSGLPLRKMALLPVSGVSLSAGFLIFFLIASASKFLLQDPQPGQWLVGWKDPSKLLLYLACVHPGSTRRNSPLGQRPCGRKAAFPGEVPQGRRARHCFGQT